jgi:hypothetical protein
MSQLTCEGVEAGGLVERYTAGQLAPAEQDAFESHFLTCDRCQRALLLGAAIRASLPNTPLPARPSRRVGFLWGIGLAAAAGLATVLLLPTGEASGSLRRLGDLTVAPIYLGIPVRGAPLPGDSIFDRAMSAYRDAHYGQAIVALRIAVDAGVDRAPAEFFLAASQLMTNRAQPAADGFTRVIDLGATPYLAEAHYYRAKALLRLGRPDAALADLVQASEHAGATGTAARALADSVKELLPR